MEALKLISCTDFILKIDEIEPKAVNFSSITDIRNYQLNSYSKIVNYANFLKQPLKLGMFIPCDENGNVLEEPKFTKESALMDLKIEDKYQQAKERVIFEGFVLEREQDGTFLVCDKFHFDVSIIEHSTIEDFSWSNLKLTDSAIKQIKKD